jgi:hypothetical protein
MEYALELGVSQELDLAGLILSLKRKLQSEFKVWDIGVKITGVAPNVVTKPDGVGTHYVMRVVSLNVVVPLSIDPENPRLFYSVIEKFTENSDSIILLSRF